MPALTSDCAPMMLRVRPAQLTTTSVSGRGASSPTRYTSSAPGTLMPPGMLIVRYSSNRRASSTTTSACASRSALSSSADSDGVWRVASTSSPNALLGTFTSRKISPPDAPPAVQAAVEHGDARVSQSAEPLNRVSSRVVRRRRRRRWASCGAGCDRALRPPGDRAAATPRTTGGPRERRLLAHVEQRDLAPLDQGAANLSRRNNGSSCECSFQR